MEDYVGLIKMFAGTQAPRGWAFCQGQIMQVNTNQALFAILGATYGGDGKTTFALPNLQGVVPIGWGASPSQGSFNFGQKGGAEQIPLTANNLPPHVHPMTGNISIACNTDGSETNEPNAGYPAITDAAAYAAPTTSTGTMAVTGTVTPGVAGGSAPIDKRMPFVAINYIICISGLYPSRN